MPAIVAFLIALLAAFVQNRELGFAEKIKLAAQGVGDENIITMCLIFLAAGAFTGAVKAAGGVDSTVNLGLSILPSNVAVAGLFLIGCFISISMGTSVGTITALAPIAVGISQKPVFHGGLRRRRGGRRHVRGQPVHDIRHNHSCGKDTGLRDEG